MTVTPRPTGPTGGTTPKLNIRWDALGVGVGIATFLGIVIIAIVGGIYLLTSDFDRKVEGLRTELHLLETRLQNSEAANKASVDTLSQEQRSIRIALTTESSGIDNKFNSLRDGFKNSVNIVFQRITLNNRVCFHRPLTLGLNAYICKIDVGPDIVPSGSHILAAAWVGPSSINGADTQMYHISGITGQSVEIMVSSHPLTEWTMTDGWLYAANLAVFYK